MSGSVVVLNLSGHECHDRQMTAERVRDALDQIPWLSNLHGADVEVWESRRGADDDGPTRFSRNFDLGNLPEDLGRLIDDTGMTARDWSGGRFVVMLPGNAGAAGVLLAMIHGRSGGFPIVTHSERVGGAWEVTHCYDLQAVRADSRRR